MKFAVIAAGEGSRLVSEGCEWSKPLVRINGVSLVERLIRIFIRSGASQVAVVINEKSNELVDTDRKSTRLNSSHL